MEKEKLINNLFALWDPLGVKKIARGIEYGEYNKYAIEVLKVKEYLVKDYLIEIYTDMVDDPDKSALIEIETMVELILLIRERD